MLKNILKSTEYLTRKKSNYEAKIEGKVGTKRGTSELQKM